VHGVRRQVWPVAAAGAPRGQPLAACPLLSLHAFLCTCLCDSCVGQGFGDGALLTQRRCRHRWPQHHCRRCGCVFCADCSTHRICFRYETVELTRNSSDEEEGSSDGGGGSRSDRSEAWQRDAAAPGTGSTYGSPQRVCSHCFYCSILAPLVEWVYERPVDGFAPSEDLSEAVDRLQMMTTAEASEWIGRPVLEGGSANASAEAEDLGLELPPLPTMLQWAKVLLEMDGGLAALYADVKAGRQLPDRLFWMRYFTYIREEMLWAEDEGEDDGEDFAYDEEDGYEDFGNEYEGAGPDEAEEEEWEARDQRPYLQHEGIARMNGPQDDQTSPERGSVAPLPSAPAPARAPPPQPAMAPFPLKQALKARDVDRVMEMVHDSRTANSMVDANHTLLHVAVLQNDTQLVEHLLVRRANVNAVSVHGDPPLFAAVCHGNLAMVELLVGAGANVNLPAANSRLAVQQAEMLAATAHTSEARTAVADGDVDHAAVSLFLREIYQAKAAQIGNVTADELFVRLATVWNQRRRAYAAQARASGGLRQPAATAAAGGTGVGAGPSSRRHGGRGSGSSLERRQAQLQVAQAQARQQQAKTAVLRDIARCSV
jgi:hypothetical protein